MSILADFQKGQQMVIGREAATTANLANRLTREGLRREEKSRAANEDLAYLSNDVIPQMMLFVILLERIGKNK